MTKGVKDIVSGSVLFALATVMFIAAFDIEPVLPVGVGSGFFPKVVAIMLAGVSALIVIQGVRIRAREVGQPVLGGGAGRIVLATLLLITFYVAFLQTLGFLVTTFLYLFGQFTVLAPAGQRNLVAFAGVAAVVSVGTYFTFLNLFDLILPTGILG